MIWGDVITFLFKLGCACHSAQRMWVRVLSMYSRAFLSDFEHHDCMMRLVQANIGFNQSTMYGSLARNQ